MTELFVYYRVVESNVDDALEAVSKLQRTLETRMPGLTARLFRRLPEEGRDRQTWMETYSVDGALKAAGIDHVAIASIEREAVALLPWIEGERTVEVFESIGRR